MSAGFTLGPWDVQRERGGDDYTVWASQPFTHLLATVVWDDEEIPTNVKANAHLIAAAPALYDVADEFLCSLELLERHGPHLTCADGEFISASTLTDRAEALRAALKQARGDLVDPLEQVRS